MKTFIRFIISLALIFTLSSTVFGSELSGVSISALGCKVKVPEEYVLSLDSDGALRGNYVGKHLPSNPIFQYYPSDSYDSRAEVVKRIIWEENIGDYRILRVDLGQGLAWDVVATETSFFASWASPDNPFISQFEACAASS